MTLKKFFAMSSEESEEIKKATNEKKFFRLVPECNENQ